MAASILLFLQLFAKLGRYADRGTWGFRARKDRVDMSRDQTLFGSESRPASREAGLNRQTGQSICLSTSFATYLPDSG
jgi:hypothetical protein